MSQQTSPSTHYPNGNTHTPLTPFQPPLGPPLGPLAIRQDSTTSVVLPSPVVPQECSSDNFTEENQQEVFSNHLKRLDCTFGVWYPTGGNRNLCESIVVHMRELLSGGVVCVKVLEMKRDGQSWMSVMATEKVKYHVFVGLPPIRAKQYIRQNSTAQEEDFFTPVANEGHRVCEVVFIDLPPTTPSQRHYIPKNIKGFLHLDSRHQPQVLARRILGHFGASQPVPYDIDNAYWSKMPKLIPIIKDRASLGITLVTREMSPTSIFPRIALIKALNDDCVSALRSKVGRYTHIQSINGCPLDGFSIKSISTIFQQETRDENVQLMVRFIHSRRSDGPPPPPKNDPLDPEREDLPVPLFILSDSHKSALRLFDCLTTDHTTQANSSLAPPTVSVANGTDISDDPKIPMGAPNSCLEAFPAKSQRTNKIWFQFAGDESMRRGSIGASFSDASFSASTPMAHRPGLERMRSVRAVANRHYVPQIFKSGFERRFAHIFLRTAGLYLVTAWLKDLADDPLIQFENLSYWLRLIQQKTRGEEKRTIIVGLFDGNDKEDLQDIREYTAILNDALHESDLHNQLFDQRQSKRDPNSRHSYVFEFDISSEVDSSFRLYSCIEQCMDLFIEKSYRFYNEVFQRVFVAFNGLNVALKQLAAMKKIVATSEDLKTLCKQKPSYALRTLQAYSPSLIDSTIPDALLMPHFLVELMTKLGSWTEFVDEGASIYQVFTVGQRHLRPLPLVTFPLPGFVMENIVRSWTERRLTEFPLNDSEKEAVVRWAEFLELMFRIEGDGPKRETYYFVPSLATEMMGEGAKYHWDNEKERYLSSKEATVLFAYLNFPANHQFFNRLLAVLIKEGLVKRLEMYINRGCTEAIMPLLQPSAQSPFIVLLKYHALQNVIEFKTRTHGAMKQAFKNSVLEKLSTAFSSSQFERQYTVQEAFTLQIPSKQYTDKLSKGALFKLMEKEMEEDEDDICDKLLRTEEFSPKNIHDWEGAYPQAREIPVEYFLKWSKILGSNHDYWTMVGSKLGLLTTTDINFLHAHPNPGGNGAEVLSRWKESNVPVTELIRIVKEVGLVTMGTEIEECLLPGSDV